MFKNYLNVALRSLIKHKFYSAINVLGLTVGLTCFFLISLFVVDEVSYDKHLADTDRIYRMDFSGTINGNSFITALAGAPTAEAMVNDFPEVEDAFRFRGGWERLIKQKGEGNTNFKQENVVYADKNFFRFFGMEMLYGDPTTALDRPDALVVSQSFAKKVFGRDDVVGEMLVLDNENDFEIMGVYKDMPSNTHFGYEVMLSMEARDEAKQKIWLSFNFNTYLKLTPGTDPKTLEEKFPNVIETYIGPDIEQYMGQSMEDFYASGNTAGFELFPLSKIHLQSDKLGELEANGSMQYVYIFGAIALFILILACINFMNLSTARSANRAKEVGVRKVMGAYREHLINQFLSEAFMITLISIILAFGISYLALPYFNELADKTISSSGLFTPGFLLITLGILITVGFLAGSYPAFYLSAFKPVEVLKGKLNLGMKSGGIRSTLVVIQFTVSIIMMIGTAIVFNQLSYIQNKKLGYDKNHIVMIEDAWLMGDKVESFKTEALRDARILRGTIASFLPVGTTNNNNLWFKGQTAGQGDNFVLQNYRIDHDYIGTLGMEMVAGRPFSKEFMSDSTGLILNEAAARHLGFDEPIGSHMSTYGGSQQEPVSEAYKVIGVVKDFHFGTMRESIEPLVFSLGNQRGFISFKIQGEDVAATVNTLENLWNEFAPGQPFSYTFMDDRYNQMYEAEQRIGNIFTVFASLAIFIACLGLYGLSSFTAEQKTKEIGIRKVLGASIPQIIVLLSKEFMKLVGISFIIGSIGAYFVMKEWLNDFVYRIDINNPLTFLTIGLMAIVIASATMTFQSVRAARTNPVNSLKDE
ncbi:MAG: ABC transporter permease [Cyclobacteriaceae bacterium]